MPKASRLASDKPPQYDEANNDLVKSSQYQHKMTRVGIRRQAKDIFSSPWSAETTKDPPRKSQCRSKISSHAQKSCNMEARRRYAARKRYRRWVYSRNSHNGVGSMFGKGRSESESVGDVEVCVSTEVVIDVLSVRCRGGG
jgi:hypothetical protein